MGSSKLKMTEHNFNLRINNSSRFVGGASRNAGNSFNAERSAPGFWTWTRSKGGGCVGFGLFVLPRCCCSFLTCSFLTSFRSPLELTRPVLPVLLLEDCELLLNARAVLLSGGGGGPLPPPEDVSDDVPSVLAAAAAAAAPPLSLFFFPIFNLIIPVFFLVLSGSWYRCWSNRSSDSTSCSTSKQFVYCFVVVTAVLFVLCVGNQQ
mmetsp:Transcript_54152/g.61253  ORF Transcript_54152/g.61253 Transcript_54152/m.61253 type:complete len:206 (-) Transcript_54152:1064-1681(-)